MKTEDLKNLLIFMKRVPVTGEEALAWAQSYLALQAAYEAATAPPDVTP